MSRIKQLEDLELFDVTGTVIDHQSWAQETSITTVSDGTTHAEQGYQHGAGPRRTTRTFTTQKLRMFLKLRGGQEREITLSDPGVGVREGHSVSVLYGHNKRDEQATPVAFCNHSTHETKIYEPAIHDLVERLGMPKGCLMLLIIPLAISALGSVIGGAIGFGSRVNREIRAMDEFAARSMPGHQFDKVPAVAASHSDGILGFAQAGLGPMLWWLSLIGVAIWLLRRRRSLSALRAAAVGRVQEAVRDLQSRTET